ncbi:uncharacterized protein B0I36DRAFT_250511 [Microdochium trichocladiopsis]|uniref:Rhodopsin domain-containing protein n=1 Tax=Microdochium trichocladiopsis TaxID=1682393 RepID=A0A9P9BQ24_9PEZI|nr:uncharacterized protein B0I36DRAFT_250511 [Microdochium trichocladiopsis]KAH7025106.1 hypothetical protein B0I36DRAFT_250511 [Microdochium trichocladiopsis]
MAASTTLSAQELREITISYGTIIGTGLLALLVCGTRLYVRKYVKVAFGIDDWACLLALLLVTTFNGIGIAVVHYGAGKRMHNVSQEDMAQWFLLYYVCVCIYLSISFAVKTNLLLFLRRVFPNAYIQHTTLGMLIFLVLFTISGSFAAAFQCTPPKYFYKLEFLMAPDRADHCFSAHTSYIIFLYQAVVIFICDVIMFLLPIPALLQLNLSASKRWALVLVFASGGVACIAPALRFSSLSFHGKETADTTFDAASSLYWMAIEYNLGLVAGSLTSLRPLFARYGLFRTAADSNRRQSRGAKRMSYRLDDSPGSSWGHGRSGHGQAGAERYQGDSVLATTVVDQTIVDQKSIETSHAH